MNHVRDLASPGSGLLRTSTSRPSWIFEALVPVPKAFGIQRRSLRTETRNLEIQDGEDVMVLRRPGQVLGHLVLWPVFTSWRSFLFSFCNSWILSRSSLSSEVKLEISFDNSRCVLRLCSLISRLSNSNFSISFSNSAFCWFAWSRWIDSSFFVSIKVHNIARGRHKRSI